MDEIRSEIRSLAEKLSQDFQTLLECLARQRERLEAAAQGLSSSGGQQTVPSLEEGLRRQEEALEAFRDKVSRTLQRLEGAVGQVQEEQERRFERIEARLDDIERRLPPEGPP